MEIDDKIKQEEDIGVDELTTRPVWEDLPGIDERVKEVLQEGIEEPQADTTRETVIPRIKGLEALKEGVFTVDVEKTITDMFMVIKSMEAQLDRVLKINSHLEKDRNEARETVAESMAAKSQLEDKIARMEMELPSKRELQMEVDQLIEERNSVQVLIQEQKARVEKMQKTMIEHQRRIGNLEEEKGDTIAEVHFLESRLNAASERIKSNDHQINELRGENLSHVEKIKTLEEDLKATLDDKYKLLGDVKKSKKALAELHTAFSDKKLQAKKSFYKDLGEDQE